MARSSFPGRKQKSTAFRPHRSNLCRLGPIGPGMAIFSKYSKIIEADGADMSVRVALAIINQVLAEVLSDQEGDFDSETRFCIKWFEQFGWNESAFSTWPPSWNPQLRGGRRTHLGRQLMERKVAKAT